MRKKKDESALHIEKRWVKENSAKKRGSKKRKLQPGEGLLEKPHVKPHGWERGGWGRAIRVVKASIIIQEQPRGNTTRRG